MMRVLIIGDSTVQWIRPCRNHKNELTYTELLRKEGMSVDVVSSPGMTSKEVLSIYWNELSAKFYDVCVVSVGINDLTPRSYPRWMWRVNNNLLVRESKLSKIYMPFYKILTNHYIQKTFSKNGVSRTWISLKLFRLYLRQFQELVLKESDSKIIYLSLPAVSERISSLLYGIEENIVAYKQEMCNLIDNNRVLQIDIDTLFQEDMERYNTEGIHYTSEGHKKIFEALVEKLRED